MAFGDQIGNIRFFPEDMSRLQIGPLGNGSRFRGRELPDRIWSLDITLDVVEVHVAGRLGQVGSRLRLHASLRLLTVRRKSSSGLATLLRDQNGVADRGLVLDGVGKLLLSLHFIGCRVHVVVVHDSLRKERLHSCWSTPVYSSSASCCRGSCTY